MADDHVYYFRQNAGSAPASVPVNGIPPAQDIRLEVATATFNGSGASGSFKPCCSIYSQSGQLIARTAGSTVTAGDSAEITFLPFLGSDVDAIHYGINDGDFLFITTEGVLGMIFRANNADITLIAKDIVLNTPFFISESGVPLTPHSFTVRLGEIGTGSYFEVDHAGVGNPLIHADSDSESIEFNLNQTLSHFQVFNAAGDAFSVFGDGSTVVHLRTASTSSFTIRDSSNNVLVQVQETGDMTFSLGASGAAYIFTDNAGNPIFQINADGSLHGLTGQTLTFDL